MSEILTSDTITFGKYHKVHVCNLKEFKVYGGLELGNMTELLHSGLRNDSEPETFQLKFVANGVQVPIKYIKIVPLLAWGANFNFSIWSIALAGLADDSAISKSYNDFVNYRENEAIRLTLKHLRQRNRQDLFEMVKGDMLLEHPILTDLHRHIVINADFDQAEKILQASLRENYFDDYISSLPYKALWTRIQSPSGPSMRGGHQMCIDSEEGIIYLFGGWDGTKDLSDFWAFYSKEGLWKCLSMDTRMQGGPEPRSCHKICFDSVNKVIYTLGKYVDPDSRPNIPLDSDFWKYDLVIRLWTKISSNTMLEGGPDLIYDHQMLVDVGMLYVFGGRSISPDPAVVSYSGLYSFNLITNQWRLIRPDVATLDSSIQMKARIGHSMLLNQDTKEIYIFAGQRHKDFLADFYVYKIEEDKILEISRDYSKSGGPDAGFTQRATIDTDLNEFYVLSGLMREKNSLCETKNAFWVYSLKRNKWIKVYENDNVGAEYWAQMLDVEPRPRFAHQLVYDSKRKCQYLFGGNPGETNHPNLRLDDFWELRLTRPNPEDILRKGLFEIRKLKFIELCSVDKSVALDYLQSKVSLVVNHEDPEESKVFRELAINLFSWKDNRELSDGKQYVILAFTTRMKLYERVLEYYPDAMREPKANLVDLIPMGN